MSRIDGYPSDIDEMTFDQKEEWCEGLRAGKVNLPEYHWHGNEGVARCLLDTTVVCITCRTPLCEQIVGDHECPRYNCPDCQRWDNDVYECRCGQWICLDCRQVHDSEQLRRWKCI